MAIALVYDPRYHTFESWASLMVEAYEAQQLEIPDANTDWRQWANGFNGIALFANDGIPFPDPIVFQDWSDWATALVNTVNQPR